MRFTDRSIAGLKTRDQRYEVWEDGHTGLGVRVGTTGRKSWIYLFRFEARPRRLTLGVYPRMGLADARLAHAKARKLLQEGIDPGRQHLEARRAEQDAETVSELIEEFLKRHVRPNRKGAQDLERALRRDVEPAWGKRTRLARLAAAVPDTRRHRRAAIPGHRRDLLFQTAPARRRRLIAAPPMPYKSWKFER